MVFNHFYNRLLIKDSDEFFDRNDELAMIFRLIDMPQPQSISIVADGRLGKSSLLYQIYSRYKNVLKNPDDYLFCYLDLEAKEAYLSPQNFYSAVLRSAQVIIYPEPIDFHKFEDGLKKIRESNKKLVLLLDGFDTLIKDIRFDSIFLGNLRSLAQQYDLSYIIASQRPLKDICHNETKWWSPFFNIFHRIDLSVFKREEAEEMLSTLSERGGRGFSNEIIKDILDYVGSHPYLICRLAHYVFDELGRDGSFKSAVERFLPEARGHVEYYLNNLTDRERIVIEDLNKGISQFNDKLKEHLKINKEEINRLRNSGWLIEKDGEYQLVPVFTEGLYPVNPVNPVKNHIKEGVKMAINRNTEELDFLKEELKIHKKNLGRLKLQKAGFGSLNVPLHILNQIEDEENEIKRLEKEIEESEEKGKIIKHEIPKEMPKTDSKIEQNINISNSQNVSVLQASGDVIDKSVKIGSGAIVYGDIVTGEKNISTSKKPLKELLDHLSKEFEEKLNKEL